MSLFKKSNTNDNIPNYNKLADNLYVNHDERKIIINNYTFNFSKILGARIVENGIERVLGSKIGSTNVGVGIRNELTN